MSRTEDCQAGLFTAVPQPIRNVNISRLQGLISPKEVHPANTTETGRTAGGVEACTGATSPAEPVRDVISHAAPTDWISPPRLEMRKASHTARKAACRRGEKGDGRALGF